MIDGYMEIETALMNYVEHNPYSQKDNGEIDLSKRWRLKEFDDEFRLANTIVDAAKTIANWRKKIHKEDSMETYKIEAEHLRKQIDIAEKKLREKAKEVEELREILSDRSEKVEPPQGLISDKDTAMELEHCRGMIEAYERILKHRIIIQKD